MAQSLRRAGAPSVHDSLSELLASGGRSYSFEFFPPKDDAGEVQLWAALRRPERLGAPLGFVALWGGGAAADVRLGDLRGGWLHPRPDDPDHRADRPRHHADPGRAPDLRRRVRARA